MKGSEQITLIQNAHLHAGSVITIRGHVSKIQSFPKHVFLEIRDGAGDNNKIQVVSKPNTFVAEQYLEITGKVATLPQGKWSYQPVEIHLLSFVIFGSSNADFTTRCPESAGPDIKLQERHLHLRSRNFALTTVLRSLFLRSLRYVFEKDRCTELIPPCFVGNQCEGGATLFNLKYPANHGDEPMEAYLTQSSQFYLEMAVPAIGDCYCIYPR